MFSVPHGHVHCHAADFELCILHISTANIGGSSGAAIDIRALRDYVGLGQRIAPVEFRRVAEFRVVAVAAVRCGDETAQESDVLIENIPNVGHLERRIAK